MSQDLLAVALITEVFPDATSNPRLLDLLWKAKEGGGDLAVLPELPLNPWSPATQEARSEDAEELDGPRQTFLSQAAAEVGIAVAGGAIIRDPSTGVRHNTALLYDKLGSCLARYRKVHLPAEEGYWETSHYEPGEDPPEVIGGLSLPIGIQICSDVNRPSGFQLLAAMGAEVVLAPRCTPSESYERWKLVLRANAVTSASYVISTNRPGPEKGVPIGGPSIAIGPSGEVIAESQEPLCMVNLDRATVSSARTEYPGYLDVFPELYAAGWRRVGGN
jgi:N-carbamoylputrescine amidase